MYVIDENHRQSKKPNPKKRKIRMQEINAQVRNNVRSSLLPFLNANAPIRNIEAKASLLRQLGYTRDQFGFSDSGVSKIEILIGNEFFRLKNFKRGQIAYCKLLETLGAD